jgi:hypothetical protein
MTTQDVLGGWREQFDRMWRSYYRFLNAYSPGVDSLDSRRGLGSPGPAELALYDSIHFIQDAWHLKDWLKADPVTSSLGEAIEKYAHETGSLKICRALCNATKHLEERRREAGLTDYPRYGWVVTFLDQELDPLQLAVMITDSWDSWLTDHHLPINRPPKDKERR